MGKAPARKLLADTRVCSTRRKKSEVAGEMEGRLRFRIAAQAVDNKANKALTTFVAKLLGVRPNRVSLENGETSRKKTLKILDLSEPDWNALGVSDVPS